MKSLFLRIFLSFWAAQALFLVLAILVTIAMRPARDPNAENMRAQVLVGAVNAYRAGGEHAAGEYLEDLQQSQHIHAYVFDPSGPGNLRAAGPALDRGNVSYRPVPPSWLDRPPAARALLRGRSNHRGAALHIGCRTSARSQSVLRTAWHSRIGDRDRRYFLGPGVLSAGLVSHQSGGAFAAGGAAAGGGRPGRPRRRPHAAPA